MTLEALYYVSQIVAVLAILGSLIFVGVQVQQNTKQAKAAAALAVYKNYADWYMWAGEDLTRAEIGIRGFKDIDSLSDEDNVIFMGTFMALFAYIQSAFYLWQDGSLREEIWRTMEATLTTVFATPGGKAFWQRRRFSFADAFAAHIEDNVMNRPLPEDMRPWVTAEEAPPATEEEPNE